MGSPCPTEKSCASPEVGGARAVEAPDGLEGRVAARWAAASTWLHRRRNVLWAGRIALLFFIVAVYVSSSRSRSSPSSPRAPRLTPTRCAQYTAFFGTSRPYTCPNPFVPRPDAPSLKSRSSALTLPTLSPSFALTLIHDLSTCNAFEVVISRTDIERCTRTEYEVEPSLDEELNQWIKSRLGPDTFAVQVEGAERQLLDVPSEYLANCSYAYRFNLVNAGKVWVTVELLHEVRL